MKASELLTALALPLDIARNAPPAMQLAQHVRLAEGKACATNGALAVEIHGTGLDLDCCVPAPRFASVLEAIAQLAPEADVRLKAENKRLAVSASRMRHTVPTLPAQDLPLPTWSEKLQPLAGWPALVQALAFVQRAAVRKDINRPYLTGVATVKGSLGASDGHRAHYAPGEAAFLTRDLIVPIDAIAMLTSLSEVSAIGTDANGNALVVQFPKGRLRVQLVAATFPDLGRIVPAPCAETAVTVERSALERAVGAMRKSRLTPGVQMSITTDKLVLEDRDTEHEGRVELEIAYKGAPWSYGLNSQYLHEACQALDGEHLTFSIQPPGEGGPKPLRLSGAHPTRVVVIMAYKT